MPIYTHVPSNIGIGLLGFTFLEGSDYEVDGSYGTSHLMEHLICKSYDYLLPKMCRLGVSNDASTSSDRTTFYFCGLDESLAEVASEVYTTITSGEFTWTQEAFEAEKQTVLQEYEDVFNSQERGVIHNLIRKHWNYYLPIGLRSNIERFTYKDSLEARARYRAPNLVCEVGKPNLRIDSTKVSRATPPPLRFGNWKVPLEKVPRGGKTVVGLMGNKCIGREEENQVGLVLSCLNDGLESPLAREIRDLRGLSYFSDAGLYPIAGEGILTFFATTSKRNRKELRKVYQEFFSGDLSRHLSEDRFQDCITNLRISKITGERLPHSGATVTVLNDSPYTGMENFGYQEAVNLLEKHFGFDNYVEFEY